MLDAHLAANGLLQGAAGQGGHGGHGGRGGHGGSNPMVSLDGPLCDALFAPRKGQPPPPEPRPTQLRLSDVRARFTAALDPFTRLSGGTLDKPVLRTGRAPPTVLVSTTQVGTGYAPHRR